MATAPQLPDHHCPGCGVRCRAVPRYPWHFCNDCRRRARDGDGNRLEFANVSFSGGLAWRRVGEEAWCEDHLAVRCLIGGRPAIVREARFGGVVAEPDRNGRNSRLIDLTRQGAGRA